MKDNVKKVLFDAIKEIARVVLSALAALLALVGVSSCGTTTRALVTNNRENTTTTITISTSNSNDTKVNTSPDIDVLNKPKNE